MANLSEEGFVVSDLLNLRLNAIVSLRTNGTLSEWKGNYEVCLFSGGICTFSPIKPNVPSFDNEDLRLGELSFLRTPRYVKDSKQKAYICFWWEGMILMAEVLKEIGAHLERSYH